MVNYKCIQSFTTKNGKRYTYGQTIPNYEYSALPYNEQFRFVREIDSTSSWIGSNISDNSIDIPAISISSNDNFEGFGGGDFGGGGASGDF